MAKQVWHAQDEKLFLTQAAAEEYEAALALIPQVKKHILYTLEAMASEDRSKYVLLDGNAPLEQLADLLVMTDIAAHVMALLKK